MGIKRNLAEFAGRLTGTRVMLPEDCVFDVGANAGQYAEMPRMLVEMDCIMYRNAFL